MRVPLHLIGSVCLLLLSSGYYAPQKKVFGEYVTDTAMFLELRPDYSFISKVYGCGLVAESKPFINSGNFEVHKDTVTLFYKTGIIDSLGFPPKNLWRKNKLFYINVLTGKISKHPYAFKYKVG